jgi:hypothetical protein
VIPRERGPENAGDAGALPQRHHGVEGKERKQAASHRRDDAEAIACSPCDARWSH